MIYLAACAIFRDEAPYLADWLRFHLAMGVEHFQLYDNGSVDDSVAVIRDTVPPERLTLHTIPGPVAQMPAYRHALHDIRGKVRWVAMFDIDEFLYCPDGRDLRDFLSDFEAHPAVGVQRLEFGHDGHEQPPALPVPLAYRRRAGEDVIIRHASNRIPPDAASGGWANGYLPINAHVKSISDPGRAVDCRNPHCLVYRDGIAVNEKGNRTGPWAWPPAYQRIRINHYWSRSLAEFRRKHARPRADSGTRYAENFLNLKLEACMDVQDDTIVPLARRAGLIGPDDARAISA